MGSDGRSTDGRPAPTRDGTRVAVIDLGSNSTRLLVADVGDGDLLREHARESSVTRLGRGVDLTGKLSDEGLEAVCDAVAGYMGQVEVLAPDHTVAIATSAVRDAANGEAFIAELRERFALSPRILDGETEARLTFAGATAGRDDREDCVLVVDIGGGSTELVAGCEREVEFWSSLQTGVVRQTERHVTQDPPSPGELEELADEVRTVLVEEISATPPPHPELGIAVAGTPTSLAAIDMELDPYDPALVHGYSLTMESIQHLLARLSSISTAARRELPGLHPARAPTIVAGVLILIQVMRAFGLDRIEVSEHDLLHGAALDAVGAVPSAAR